MYSEKPTSRKKAYPGSTHNQTRILDGNTDPRLLGGVGRISRLVKSGMYEPVRVVNQETGDVTIGSRYAGPPLDELGFEIEQVEAEQVA